MLELFDLAVFLLKKEVTEGTDSVPTTLLNAINIENARGSLIPRTIERKPSRAFFSNPRKIVTSVGFALEGDVNLTPPVAAGDPSPYALLYEICGFAQTLSAGVKSTYNPVSTGIPSATGYWYQAAEFHKVLAARGDLSGMSMAVGSYFKAKTKIVGNAVAVAEAAVPNDAVYTPFVEPTPLTMETMSLIVNGVAVDGLELSVDLNNDLVVIEHTENRVGRIKNRQPTGVMRMFRHSLAALNVEALFRSQQAITIAALGGIGLGAGKQHRMTVKAALGEPKKGEFEGHATFEVPLNILPSDTGNDEVIVEFGTLA